MKNLPFTGLILLLLFLPSCDPRMVDYGYSTTYFVQNKLGTPIIVEVDNYQGNKENTDTIPPELNYEIYRMVDKGGKGGKINKTELPFNLVIFYQDTMKLNIYNGDTAYWQFSSRPYDAKYLLVVDSILLIHSLQYQTYGRQ